MERLLAVIGTIMLPLLLWASPLATDSAANDMTADSVVHKRGFIDKIVDYFATSNQTKPQRRFDVSVIGGPHYSSDTGLGLGLVAAGFYRADRADTLLQPSNVSLYGDVATSGFYLIGLRGDHLFKHDSRRIDYNLYFYSFPRDFWGIGYDMGNDMSNRSEYRELYFDLSVDYLWRVAPHFYVGPAVELAYVNARRRERPELWNGESKHIFSSGAGFRAQFDNRDNLTAPQEGFLCQFEQRFCPRFMGNDYAFSYTDIRLCAYNKLWRDAVLATRLHSRWAYGNVPWNLLSTFGGSSTMRGYYEGRFRDKGEMDLTIELRQHLWRRNGLVVWLGAGTVFPKFSAIQFRRLLPNGGIGYRWEFKSHCNVRLDLGFAKGEHAIIFNINEAF